jgi:hypothetical protein
MECGGLNIKEPVQTDTSSKGEPESSIPTDEMIRRIAYDQWQARVVLSARAEEEWFAAEKELENAFQVATAA